MDQHFERQECLLIYFLEDISVSFSVLTVKADQKKERKVLLKKRKSCRNCNIIEH